MRGIVIYVTLPANNSVVNSSVTNEGTKTSSNIGFKIIWYGKRASLIGYLIFIAVNKSKCLEVDYATSYGDCVSSFEKTTFFI